MTPEQLRTIDRAIDQSLTAARRAREAKLRAQGVTYRASARALWYRWFGPTAFGAVAGTLLFAPFLAVPGALPALVRFGLLFAFLLLATYWCLMIRHRDRAAGRVAPLPLLYDDAARRVVQHCRGMGLPLPEIRYLFQLTKADRSSTVRFLENFWRYGTLVVGFVFGQVVDTVSPGIPRLLLAFVGFAIIVRFVLTPYLDRAVLTEAIDHYTK